MKPADHILSVPRISYWIALFDFGPKIGIGFSASSGNPETTRRQIIDEVRDHIAKDRCVVHVRLIEGTDMQDLTQEIISDAIYQLEHEAA